MSESANERKGGPFPLTRSLACSLTLGALAFCLSSCGYTATRILPAYYRTIYVESFQNRIPIAEEIGERVGFVSNFPEIEERVTKEVINRFLFDGNLRVTNQPDKADLILTGNLMDFYRQALRRKDDDSTVEEYRLNLTASVVLRDKEGKLLLEQSALVGDSTYFVTGSTAKTESAAVNELVTDFSRRVVEWVIEYW